MMIVTYESFMKILLCLIISFISFGISCSPVTHHVTNSILPQFAVDSTSSSKEQISFYTTHYFDQKIIPTPIFEEYQSVDHLGPYHDLFFNYGINDCLGFANGATYGGDLIQTLLKNKASYTALSAMPYNEDSQQKTYLSIFKPEYLNQLSEKVTSYIQKKYSQDFYSYYVCHLAPAIDIVTGVVWPSTTSPYFFNKNSQQVDILPSFVSTTTLLLVSNDKITEFPTVDTLPRKTAGAAVFPCSGKFNIDHVEWSCPQACKSSESGRLMWKLFFDGKNSQVESSCGRDLLL